MTKRIIFTVTISLGKLEKWLLIIVTLSLASVVHAQAAASDHYFMYDIFVEGEDIGDARIQFVQQGDGTYIIAEQSHILTSIWWGEVDLRRDYVEKYSKQAQLLNADGKTYDGDTVYWSQVHATDHEYWVTSSEIKTISSQEEEAFMGIAVGLASEYIPNVSEVLAISQLLFSNDAQQTKSYRFANNDFDTSFNHLPFFWRDNRYSLPTTIRLLDSDDLSITDYVVTGLATEKKSSQYHVNLQPDTGEPITLWLAISKAGVPHFTEIVAEDENGPLLMKLKPATGDSHE